MPIFQRTRTRLTAFGSSWYALSFRVTKQEYGGWDLQKIMETHNAIDGWSAQHVKYLMYQMICALRYLSVSLLSCCSLTVLECEYHAPRHQTIQHPHGQTMRNSPHRLRPRAPNRSQQRLPLRAILPSHHRLRDQPHDHPIRCASSLGLRHNTPHAESSATPAHPPRRYALVPTSRSHHIASTSPQFSLISSITMITQWTSGRSAAFSYPFPRVSI